MATEPYVFKPHERPLMPGSPATPDHPTARRIAYFLLGVLLGLGGGFVNGLLTANLSQIQGELGLTQVEAGWLTAAYSMTNACMALLIIKFRQQFGIRRFTRVILIGFVAMSAAQLLAHSYWTELAVRAGGGIVASGLSTLCLFYFMQSMPAKMRLAGLVLGVGTSQVALPLARAISPLLLADGNLHNLHLFEFGLTLICLAGVSLLTLPPSERMDAFEPLDFLTFMLFAPGMALLSAVLVQGRIQWWTSAPWLGWALVGAIVLIGAAWLIEHNRANPLLNTRWMTSGMMLRLGIVAAVMRILLSEQNFGTVGMLTMLGMGQDQLAGFFAVVTLATIAGMVASIFSLNPADLLRPVVISCAMIAVAAFIDSTSSNLTRPAQLFVTQSMIAFAAIYFLGPTMMSGMLQVLAKGPSHLVSFSALFGLSQTIGGLGGSALLGSFQVVRERFHSQELVAQLIASDPLVVQRMQQLGGAYGRVLGDPALRQAEGAALLAQQVAREANILAYNDVFLLVGALSTIAFLYLGGRWLWYRHRGINPLQKELEALAAMRAKAAQ